MITDLRIIEIVHQEILVTTGSNTNSDFLRKLETHVQLYVDEIYVVIVDRTLSSEATCTVVNIKNFVSRSFRIPPGSGYPNESKHHSSHYSNGLLAFVDFSPVDGNIQLK